MIAHLFHHALPETVAASPMDPFITDHRELVHAWRDEDQHCISSGGFLHSQPKKLFLSQFQHIAFYLTALQVNPDFAGSF